MTDAFTAPNWQGNYRLMLTHDAEKGTCRYFMDPPGTGGDTYDLKKGQSLYVFLLEKTFPTFVTDARGQTVMITYQEWGKTKKASKRDAVIHSIDIYLPEPGQPAVQGPCIDSLVRPERFDQYPTGIKPEQKVVTYQGRQIYRLTLDYSGRSAQLEDLDSRDEFFHFGLQVRMGGNIWGSDPRLHNKGGGSKRVEGMTNPLGSAGR